MRRGFASIIDNVSQDGSIELATRNGDARLLIPSVTNFGAFRSNLVIRNLSSFAASVDLTFRDTTGGIIASRNALAIPAGGSFASDTNLRSTVLAVTAPSAKLKTFRLKAGETPSELSMTSADAVPVAP